MFEPEFVDDDITADDMRSGSDGDNVEIVFDDDSDDIDLDNDYEEFARRTGAFHSSELYKPWRRASFR